MFKNQTYNYGRNSEINTMGENMMCQCHRQTEFDDDSIDHLVLNHEISTMLTKLKVSAKNIYIHLSNDELTLEYKTLHSGLTLLDGEFYSHMDISDSLNKKMLTPEIAKLKLSVNNQKTLCAHRHSIYNALIKVVKEYKKQS
jgi:hypothetical protein